MTRVPDAVLAVLSRCEVGGASLTLPIDPRTGKPEVLDRKMYEAVNKVLEAAGCKWNRSMKCHAFVGVDAAERLDQIILTGEVEIPRDQFDFFPTPPAVVQALLDRADLEPGMRVLEPSAGSGSIVAEVLKHTAHVWCIDVRPDCKPQLEAVGVQRGAIEIGDFLEKRCEGDGFDRIVMNPPFSRQADIHHVNHALEFLAPGGRLVSVMSAGVTFRENRLTTAFRDMVDERGGSIEPLPDGAFKPSGTGVRTVVVTIPAGAGER